MNIHNTFLFLCYLCILFKGLIQKCLLKLSVYVFNEVRIIIRMKLSTDKRSNPFRGQRLQYAWLLSAPVRPKRRQKANNRASHARRNSRGISHKWDRRRRWSIVSIVGCSTCVYWVNSNLRISNKYGSVKPSMTRTIEAEIRRGRNLLR
jgi:hypothetical protein